MKNLKIGEWYYRMMGYGGSDSQYCNIRRATGEKTSGNLYSMCRADGMGLQKLPVTEIYEAVDEKGRVFSVSANDLGANGHIGIGTLAEPKGTGHVCWMSKEDCRLLIESGVSEEEIKAEFPFAFSDCGDDEYEKYIEANGKGFVPMTDGQERLLVLARKEREAREKRKHEEANRRFAAKVEEARQKYAYVPFPVKDGGCWPSVGEKRRNVLAVLKHEFPGVKFSVRTRNGSTSDSVTVSYVDGPASDRVSAVMRQFETSQYNAYEDIHESVSTPASVVCGGFDYVFVEREYGDDLRQKVHGWLMANVGGATEEFARHNTSKALSEADITKGAEFKGMELQKNGRFAIVFAAKAEPPKPVPPDGDGTDGDGVKVRHNEEKNGIELSFPSMPSESIRNLLKGAGWRWSRFNKVWYNHTCDRSVASAEQIVAAWEKENGKEVA